MLRSVVLGCGSYLPSRVLSNAELSRMVDTSDEWIMQRTGIRERHIAAEGETTSDMGIAAARAALAAAGADAQSIDLIVLATSTPDNTFPASAVAVQAGLGINHGAAFDLQAVCSGFVFGLATVDGLLKTGAFKRALVIGSETFSRILDWNDRATCVLFGDGAGAVVVEAQLQPGTREDRGMLTSRLRSDGRHKSQALCRRRAVLDQDRRAPAHGGTRGLQARGGDDHRRDRGRLQGHRLLRRRHRLVRAAPGQPAHHRRLRARSSASRRKKWSPPWTKHGNTSAASIPLALTAAVADGRIKRGDLVLLEAMGGGFTWGSVLVRW